MNKAEMIRNVVEQNFTLTHQAVKDSVKRKYGAEVSTNQIINAVGSLNSRLVVHGYREHLLKKASEFVKTCGDHRQAIRLIRMAAT